MRRPRRFHALLALAILSSLPASLITYRHLQTNAKPLVDARQQDAMVMPLLPIQTNSAKLSEQDILRFEVGYGSLPLNFEPNRDQADPRMKSLSRAGHRTLWLTNDEAVLAVGRRSRVALPDARQAGGVNDQTVPAVLRMKFVGASTNPRIAGEARQQGTVNYFIGRPDQWRTNIHTYARIHYRSLYPGVDLIFHGDKQELEYDLVVSPRANPGRIRLGVSGVENLHLDADGNLVRQTPAGDVVQRKPRIYQRKGTKLVAIAATL